MAIIPESQYPSQTTPASTNYPYGAARDVSSPGAGDGTPVQQAWVNDWFGFQQAAMQAAGITPSGNPDTAPASQVLEAMTGRLIKVSTINANTTFVPQAATKRIHVIVVGGGGGGTGARATISGNMAGGAGGGGGGYAESLITDRSLFLSVPVTIGSGGAGGIDAGVASNGGTTSFGSLLSASGGEPGSGTLSSDISSGSITQQIGGGGGIGTGGNIANGRGGCGGNLLLTNVANSIAGRGGDSRLSGGPRPTGLGSTSSNGVDGILGAGGAGALSVSNPGGSFNGGSGGNGAVIVWEYT